MATHIAGEGGLGAPGMAETDAQARIASIVLQPLNGFGIPKQPKYLSSQTSSISQNFFVRLFVTREAATLSERGAPPPKNETRKSQSTLIGSASAWGAGDPMHCLFPTRKGSRSVRTKTLLPTTKAHPVHHTQNIRRNNACPRAFQCGSSNRAGERIPPETIRMGG